MIKALQRISLCLATLITLSHSHAHIFIEYKVSFCVDDNGVKGVFVHWSFDQMFSSFIKKEFDRDKNNELSKEEQQAIYATAFKDLEKSNYFTLVTLNGKAIPLPDPRQFNAAFLKDGGNAAYTFFLPLNITATKEQQEIELYFFDPVIYVAFTVLEKDIGLQNRSKKIKATLTMKTVKYVNRPAVSFNEG